MKITKLSLVAALLIGSSAMALENTKVTGDANLFYQTSDGYVTNGANKDGLFSSGKSSADISVNLNVTTDVLKTDSVAISAGVGYTVLTTLGLEGQMVDNAWAGAHEVTPSGVVKDASWVNEAWFATTSANTTVKVGRMELDTPLAFTETWTIEKNTFESAVVINQDIPNTILVGAYIGRGNGVVNYNNTGAVVDVNGEFTNYGSVAAGVTGKGAYAVAAINNSWEPLTIQAWYYDIVAVATATWLQADYTMGNIIAGAQYTTISLNDSNAYALMVGYAVEDSFTAKIAYSAVDTNGDAGFNTATYRGGGSQSKLYTEAWWNYGNNTTKGAQTTNLTVEAPLAGIDFGAYITAINHDTPVSGKDSLIEYTATASKSIGFVDATLVYIHSDVLEKNQDNTLQVYLTANF
ncbi:hypothetical protein JHD47_02955 [Sulfurimonas sp. SAG-AH-194-L11]|nr:hypothetical protein [Sulfurimonas sp. SAG-AH-194-L11]MDF1876771.1 hypothetical protein [Sulfurimonas sp. SAG-AH-194-L11]